MKSFPADEPFVLVGESFSGPLAIHIAAAAPPGLAAVVLVASFHRRPVSPGFAALARFARLLFSVPAPRLAIRWLLAGLDAPKPLVEELQSVNAAVRPAVLAARVRAALEVDASRDLAASRAPLLYLGGAQDRLLRPGIPDEIRSLRPVAEV